MKLHTILASITALLFTTVTAFCHDEHEGHAGHGQVGKVNFSNSCAPAVQADLTSAVAMLSKRSGRARWPGNSTT